MKVPAKRLTIGEASRQVGLSETTLRDYDRRGLVRPRRDHAGWRIYTRADLERLRQLAGTDEPEGHGR